MVNSDQKFTKKVMHTFPETGAGVPAFLAKLWRLVEDPETNNLICWSKDGRSFIIQNQAQFAHDLLPLNYKHNNMASFIRQLNMYGFHKITSIDNGGLKFDRDEMEFTHPCFKRNCPYLLEHIKRKIATNKVDDKATVKPEAVSKVLQDVKAMRGRQDSLDTRFSVMKQENEALWREIASLRQKHAKQQQIVNKLIQFLITIVQPQRNMTSVKRHMQLMINDAPGSASKMRKTSESETNCGPIIHELSEELLDEVADSENEIMIPNSPFSEATTPTHRDIEKANSPEAVERPQSSASMMSQHHDFSNHSTEEMMGYGNSNMSNNSIAANNREALIHAVDPDGSPFYYHVTEVNDAHPSEVNTVGAATAFNDDNVLTTPMVREVMAFKKMINENIQRRSKSATNSPTLAKSQIPDEKIARKNKNTKTEPQQNPQTSFQIKAEQEMDPMLFLNVYANNQDGSLTPDPNQISPNIRESTHESNKSVTHDVAESYVLSTDVSGPTNAPKKTAMLNTVTTTTTTTNDLYDPNDFITKDMPIDLFEDTSMISSGDNSNISCENFKIFRSQQQQQQQTVGNIPTATNTKLSPHISIVGKRNGNNMASTSGAANARDNANKEKEIAAVPTTSKDASSNNTNNMALTKYRQNEDIMRLSTADEFSNHLDCIQDELESLKDMLRNDNYSLDSNTLLGNFLNDSIISNDDLRSIQKGMLKNNTLAFNNAVEIINRIVITPGSLEGDNLDKLFNDSELLGSCGFSFATDNNADKKGSELISCQPIYDLTDIINDQNDLDDDNVDTTAAAGYEQAAPVPTTPSSVLNTPRHE